MDQVKPSSISNSFEDAPVSRLEAERRLHEFLQNLKDDFDVKTKRGASDAQIRAAAYHSLGAVLDFLHLRGWRGLDFGLISLFELLLDIEDGRELPSWATKASLAGRSRTGPKPTPIRVEAIRARLAGVADYLSRHVDGMTRLKAAAYVWEKLPSKTAVFLAGTRGNKSTVARWRDNFTGTIDPAASASNEAFVTTINRLEQELTGEPITRANRMIKALVRATHE